MKMQFITDSSGSIEAFHEISDPQRIPRFEVRPHSKDQSLHQVIVPPELEDQFNKTAHDIPKNFKIEVVDGMSRLVRVV